MAVKRGFLLPMKRQITVLEIEMLRNTTGPRKGFRQLWILHNDVTETNNIVQTTREEITGKTAKTLV
jgi:hypothetical protein